MCEQLYDMDDPLDVDSSLKASNNLETGSCEVDVNDIQDDKKVINLHSKRFRSPTLKKLESVTNKFIFKCFHCSESFTHQSHLKEHLKYHKNPKEYTCVICEESFKNYKSMLNHRRSHDLDKYECQICQSVYNQFTSFKIHMRLHSGIKPYECKECGATFSQSGHLNIHQRTHTGEKPYTCDICQTNFTQISHLKTHVRTHTQDKPYQCDQCTATFTQKSSLKRHIRVHTGEKPYACRYCDMTFVVKSNLNRHLNTHTGKKPFKCDICNASFGQAIDLKRHKISHTGVKPFKCTVCKAAFSRKNNLKWHNLTHSENSEHQCPICYVCFTGTRDLKSHMRNHAPPKPYQCDLCPSSFRRLESLNRHKMIHTGERPLRLKQDKNTIDQKPKPFNCSFCESSFCEKRNLRRHVISVHQNKNNSATNENEISTDSVVDNISNDSPSAISPGTEVSSHITATASLLPESLVQHQGMLSSFQQVFLQTYTETNETSPKSPIFISSSGQHAIAAKPAGLCQNHSQHLLTYTDGNPNQCQTWCFCDPPNISETQSPQIVFAPSAPVVSQNPLFLTSVQPTLDSTTPLYVNFTPQGFNTDCGALYNNYSVASNPQIIYAAPSVCNNVLVDTQSPLVKLVET